jgi:hypothetical protein
MIRCVLMRRVSVLIFVSLGVVSPVAVGGCGPSARPTDIPPTAPDFARVSPDTDSALALGDGTHDDDDDDDEGGFGGFGGSGSDAAFDAATQDVATEAPADAEATEEGEEGDEPEAAEGGAATEPAAEPAS